jgi:hypothetical protein
MPRTFKRSGAGKRLAEQKFQFERTVKENVMEPQKPPPSRPPGEQQLGDAAWAHIVKAIRELTAPRPVH